MIQAQHIHRRYLTVALGFFLLATNSVSAQSPLDLSTAGASLAISHGVEAVFANPAHLGLPSFDGFEWRLFSLGAGVHSNAFGLDDYRTYNGGTWDETDKANILSQVPNEGWSLWSEAAASALAVRVRHLGVAVHGNGSARGRLDRDAIALALYGNADQPDWVFENSAAEGLAYAALSVSYGGRIASLQEGPLCAGVSVSYLCGLYLAFADDVNATLTTNSSGLTGEAYGESITSSGGNGVGLDAGIAWQPNKRWLVSFACENLYQSIRWNHNVEKTRYELVFDDLTVDNFEDSLWESAESTERLSSFSQGLPTRLRVGAALDFGATRWSLEGSVWTATRFAATTTPVFAGAVEHTVAGTLPLRTGIAVGGRSNLALGAGVGLRLGGFAWDVGLRVDRQLWLGNASGISAATAMDLSF